MRRKVVGGSFILFLGLSSLPAQVRDSRTESDKGVRRRLLINEKSVQVVRSTYLPGVAEPPGAHSFDVVLVPLGEGKMTLKMDGKVVPWLPGEAVFIPRGKDHVFVNEGKLPAEFLSFRIP